MFKFLINCLISFAVICFCEIFEIGNTSQQVQSVEQSQSIVQDSNIPQPPPQQNNASTNDISGIQPDSVVAISQPTAGGEPQVFYTEKGAVPDNWKGWFYIMSGADYINYIQNGTIAQFNNAQQFTNQAHTQHRRGAIANPPHYTQPNVSQQIIGRPGEYKQFIPSQQLSNKPVSTNSNTTQNITQQPEIAQTLINQQSVNDQQQTVIQQPTVAQKQTIIQPTAITQLSAIESKQPTTSDILVKEITGGEKVEQGKPDNEVPEVLIHDGAVYTLANSVEVTNTTNNENTQHQQTPHVLSQQIQPAITMSNQLNAKEQQTDVVQSQPMRSQSATQQYEQPSNVNEQINNNQINNDQQEQIAYTVSPQMATTLPAQEQVVVNQQSLNNGNEINNSDNILPQEVQHNNNSNL